MTRDEINKAFEELQERGSSCFADCLEDHKELFNEVLQRKIDIRSLNMKSTKENLKDGVWYKILPQEIFGDTILKCQVDKVAIGYWRGRWDTSWSFAKFGWEVEEATKEDLAELGNEWEPYWEEPKEEYDIVEKALELKEDVKPKQYLKQFPSGAVRSDSRGKLRVDFISPYALQLIAKHFSKNSDDFNGEEEFGVNYFQGIRPIDINQSLSRHWLDVQTALIEKDISTVKEELTALAANCIMALHQIVLEEKGLYKEEFEGISYIEK